MLLLRGACCSLLLFLVPCSLLADDRTVVEKLSVVGKKEVLPTRPGSAHLVSEEELKKFELFDVHQILRTVPGVNIQEEEGFGLRPNIGLRGADPHRSRKVTLMEDGVLIAPAPYSAPAAYFFPQMSKLESIEVFKGTPATRFGPNSIGGAINMISRTNNPGLMFKSGVGQFNTNQYDLRAGIDGYGDFSIDAHRLQTKGFKELPGTDDTGFVRQNINFRWDKYFGPGDQNLTVKVNWADERSNETYGGLTDQDFEANPNRRYVSTQLDQMNWVHQQYFTSYAISPSEDMRLRATLYHHRLKRSWNKLNGFGGDNPNNPSVGIQDVYRDPFSIANNFYYQVLTGTANSGTLDDNRDLLDVGNNQRQYYSQGLQLRMDYEIPNTVVSHNFQFNYRLHQDGITRFHESRYYEMNNSQLILSNSRNQETTKLNEADTLAHTLSMNYELGLADWTINAVTRLEDINYEETDLQTQQTIESGDEIFAPGLGVFYQAFDHFGFLAGVNKGFTPVGPGQTSNVSPEEAINYELGMRYAGKVGAELIGFYSDYQNLLGTCTQSAGCPIAVVDQRFNGGEASVLGAEFLVNSDFKTGSHTFPVQFSATYTEAQFENSFASTNNEWGIGLINSGDPIPYIPEIQSNLRLGWIWKSWAIHYNLNYLGEMADQALAQDRRFIPARTLMGMAIHYQLGVDFKAFLRVDNLTDEKYAVSRRPFGLRPGMPRNVFFGIELGLL